MAETLRELVVSLSLNGDNFSRNIKMAQNQLKEAESRFDAAGAGVENFGRTMDGLKAKSGMLSEKMKVQGQIIAQWEQALAKASATLEQNAQKNKTLATSLDAAKAKYTGLKTQIEQTRAAYQKSIQATGDNSDESNKLGLELMDLEAQYKATGDEVKKLEGQLAANTKTLKNNADAITKTETELNKAKAAETATKAELDKTTRAIETNRAQWEAAAASMDKFGKRTTAAGQGLSRVGQTLTMSVTTPLLALGGYAVKASIDAESAFADVRKTVDMTEEQFAQFDQQIKDMTVYKPSDKSAYSDITAIAAAAGQFDVANEYLKDFTETMVDLGVATDLAGTEGAMQLAQYAAVTGMAQSNFSRFGSTLVELGNTTKTTESAIMAMATKVGSAGSQVGLTDAQILGFSAALSSVGLEAEAGGSAFSKAIIGMQLAVETGKNGLKDYAKVSGMTSKEFQAAWKTDAAGAIQAFIVGLSKMDESGVSTIKTLNDMGFTEVRLRDTLMRAANANGLFSSALSSANSEWKTNTALSEEAGKRYATDTNRLIGLKAKVSTLATTYGNDLNPALDDLIDTADEWIDSLSQMDAGQRQTMLSNAAWLAAIGPGILIIGKLNTAVGSVVSAIGGPDGLIETSIKAGGGLKGLLAASGNLLGPAGIAVLAGAAIYGAAKWYDYASGAKAAREATAGMMKTAEEWSSSQAKTIFDTGNDPFERFNLSNTDFAGADDGSKQLTKLEKQYNKLLKTMNSGKAGKKTQASFGKNVEQTIELRFELAQGDGGFEKLTTGVEAEIERLKALGMETPASVYGDALSAASKGNTEQVDALNGAYSEQYAEILKIKDETARKNALDKLNAEYQEQMASAAERYAAALAKLTPGAFEMPEVKEGAEQFKTLNDLIDKYTKAGSEGEKNKILEDMGNLTKDMDEATLTSYLATMQQVNAQAETLRGLNIDPTTIIPADQLAMATTGIENFSSAVEFMNGLTGPDAEKLSGLKELLGGSVTGELKRLSDSLSLEPKVSIVQENVEAPTDLTLNAVAKFTGFIPPDATPTLDSLAAFIGYTPPAGGNPTLDAMAAFVGYTPPEGESVTLDALAAFVDYSAPATQPALDALAAFVGYTSPKGEKPTLGAIAKFVGYTSPVETPEIEVTAKITFNPKTAQLAESNLTSPSGAFGVVPGSVDKINAVVDAYEKYREAMLSGDASQMSAAPSLNDVLTQLESVMVGLDPAALKTFVEQYKALVDSGGTPSEEFTATVQAIANLMQVLSGSGLNPEGTTVLTDTLGGIFGEDWSAGLEPAVEALQALVDKATEAGVSTATEFTNGITGYTDEAKLAGQALAAGVADGVDADTYKVKDAMVRMAKAALKAAKAAMVIESPSHVMRDEVGVMIPRGVVAGIEEETARSQQAVKNAFYSLVQPALSGTQSSVNNNQRTVNNRSDLNVINPVFQMGDKLDAQAVLYELLGLMRGQQTALGGRG